MEAAVKLAVDKHTLQSRDVATAATELLKFK